MARTQRGAGQLIESVAFDALNAVDDGYGNRQQEFVEQFQTRAGFIWLRGGESVQAARLEGQQPLIVRVRVYEDTNRITPDWRMRDLRTGDVYAIRGISRSLDRGYLDVLVQSGVAQ
jgi:head-tail adaptor